MADTKMLRQHYYLQKMGIQIWVTREPGSRGRQKVTELEETPTTGRSQASAILEQLNRLVPEKPPGNRLEKSGPDREIVPVSATALIYSFNETRMGFLFFDGPPKKIDSGRLKRFADDVFRAYAGKPGKCVEKSAELTPENFTDGLLKIDAHCRRWVLLGCSSAVLSDEPGSEAEVHSVINTENRQFLIAGHPDEYWNVPESKAGLWEGLKRLRDGQYGEGSG